MNETSAFSGARLRAERHKQGWTQAELARRAGVRERQIIRWENDQHSPRFAAMVALAHALGCDVEALCEHGEESSDDDEDSAAAVLMKGIRMMVREAQREGAAA